jgi:hypothetical protein
MRAMERRKGPCNTRIPTLIEPGPDWRMADVKMY